MAAKTKDPHGGLTQAGRDYFRRKEGAHLKPGVKKKRIRDMSPSELRRKGSWAVRFYGRKGPPAPFTVEHRYVWIGQISRDIGIKLTTKSWYLTTHRISPYIDQDRDYLLQDLLLSMRVERIGFVAGVGASDEAQPRVNLTDDPYYTDGLRLVVFIGTDPRPPSSVEFLPWERPLLLTGVAAQAGGAAPEQP